MAFVIPAIPYIFAAVSAVGAIQQGKTVSNSAKADSDAQNYNAAVNKQKAEQIVQVGVAKEDQLRREARFEAGTRRAAIAESGLGLSGSNADVDRQSEVLAELDALNIRYESTTQALGYRQDAALNTWQSQNSLRRSKDARRASYIGAATGALSAYSNAGGTFGK